MPERQLEDAALWEKLDFDREGYLMEYPEYMSHGLISALQLPWDLKYGGDKSISARSSKMVGCLFLISDCGL